MLWRSACVLSCSTLPRAWWGRRKIPQILLLRETDLLWDLREQDAATKYACRCSKPVWIRPLLSSEKGPVNCFSSLFLAEEQNQRSFTDARKVGYKTATFLTSLFFFAYSFKSCYRHSYETSRPLFLNSRLIFDYVYSDIGALFLN